VTSTVPRLPPEGPAYTQTEIYAVLSEVGFPRSIWQIMDAIAGAESSWLRNVIQQGQPYAATGWGTWQITPGNSVPTVGVDCALLSLVTNARAALVKWQQQGLHAWSTYNSGKYQEYLR
jgi:hypothetical protein